MKTIRQKIVTFPKSPGVYQFIDKNGDVLYVGKAKNLYNRIKSYFSKEIGRGPAIDIMVSLSKDVKYFVTDSEIEAVLREAELINEIKPKYNIKQKDDKSFLVIKITRKSQKSKIKNPKQTINSKMQIQNNNTDNQLSTTNNYQDIFPCVELVRAKNVDFSDKTAQYFGPYPAGELLKKSIKHLRKIFPYRDCSKTKFNTQRKKGRPCIYGDIRICTGPCVDWVNPAEYWKNITYLKKYLVGEKNKIYKDLKMKMTKLAQNKCFEEAAIVRDKIKALNHLKEVAIGLKDDLFRFEGTLFTRIESFDVSNISGQFCVGSMAVFTSGKKDTDEYRKFKIRNPKSLPCRQAGEIRNKLQITNKSEIKNTQKQDDLAMTKQVLERRFSNAWPLPDLIVVDGGGTHLTVAKRILKDSKLNIPVISIAKGAKRNKNEFYFSDENIAKYFHKNPYLQNIAISARDEAHRFAINFYRKLHNNKLLLNE